MENEEVTDDRVVSVVVVIKPAQLSCIAHQDLANNNNNLLLHFGAVTSKL